MYRVVLLFLGKDEVPGSNPGISSMRKILLLLENSGVFLFAKSISLLKFNAACHILCHKETSNFLYIAW